MGAIVDKLRAKGFKLEPSGNTNLAKALRTTGVPASRDFDRVRSLPRRVLDLDNVPDVTEIFRHTARCEGGCILCRHGDATMFPIQSAMVLEAELMNGLIGGAAVGSGKTLTTLLLKAALESKVTVLIVPPAVKNQLLYNDIALYGRHYNVPTPGDGFHVISYYDLSHKPELFDWLVSIEPDLFIDDEAQNIRNPSARTKRYKRLVKLFPKARHCILSGTLMKDGLMNYAHLLQWALGGFAPIPLEFVALRDWALAIDPPNIAKNGLIMSPGVLQEFCIGDEPVQHGFRRRLLETPGVVFSKAGSLGTSLIVEHVQHKPDAVIKKALDALYAKWTWDDEEICMAARVSEVAKQLAAGFFYRPIWPNGVKDEEWLEARNAWNRFVRQYTNRNLDGKDTQKLVYNACTRGDISSREFDAWKLVEDRPEPQKQTIWISDWFVNLLIKEAKDLGSCIVWAHHEALLTKLAERGHVVFPSGPEHDDAIRVTKEPIIFASYAHATGKNLQDRWSKMIMAECPANGEACEQTIGRLHRTGQDADEVYVRIPTTCPEHENALRSAFRMELKVVDAQSGSERKLLIATRINFPKEFA